MIQCIMDGVRVVYQRECRISDIMEAAADVLHEAGSPIGITMMREHTSLTYLSADEVQKRCYLRLTLADEPGAMAQVMNVLGEHSINVASVIQKEMHPNGAVPVVILTEQAREVDFVAIETISSLAICKEEPLRMRLEDFEDEGR